MAQVSDFSNICLNFTAYVFGGFSVQLRYYVFFLQKWEENNNNNKQTIDLEYERNETLPNVEIRVKQMGSLVAAGIANELLKYR